MHPFKLDIFEDSIFVTLYDQTIVRMNKFTGEHSKIILAPFTRTSDLLVLHPLKQVYNGRFSIHIRIPAMTLFGFIFVSATHACAKTICHASAICLLSTDSSGFSCKCPDGLVETTNPKTVNLILLKQFTRFFTIFLLISITACH